MAAGGDRVLGTVRVGTVRVLAAVRVLGTEGVGTGRYSKSWHKSPRYSNSWHSKSPRYNKSPTVGTEGVGTVRVLGTVRVGLLSKHCNSCQDDGHIGHHIFTPMLI